MGNCRCFHWLLGREVFHCYTFNRSRCGYSYSFTIIWQCCLVYSIIHCWIFAVYRPTFMLFLGVFLDNESCTQAHHITVTRIWVSLALYMYSACQQHKNTKSAS